MNKKLADAIVLLGRWIRYPAIGLMVGESAGFAYRHDLAGVVLASIAAGIWLVAVAWDREIDARGRGRSEK